MRYPQENDIGKIEYKLILAEISEDRLQQLASQMKYRLEEGGGEAIYVIGVSDDGSVIGLDMDEIGNTINVIERIAGMINAKVVHKRLIEVKKSKYVAELLIRVHKEDIPIQVNVAVMGHVNAGKSTLTGTLVTGKLDDGNGSLRASIARYLHEVISGRTSSITIRILGFNDKGEAVNYSLRDPLDEADVTLNSTKIVRLIDLGGHERYLRTTLKGLLGYDINYVMLVVGADDGLSTMGKEHLAVASVLKFPTFIVITKVDKFPKEKVEGIIEDIKKVLKIPGINRLTMTVEDDDDILNAVVGIRTGRVVPIFLVSNVSGLGLDKLKRFMYMLPPRRISQPTEEPLVYIDEIYNVQGVGTVVLGSVVRGTINANQEVFIGPTKLGDFMQARVKTIQVNRVFVDKAEPGSIATFAVQGVERDLLRKGMVITTKKPKAVEKFKAKVIVLHHPTTIREGYVATIHLYTIRQAARFTKISKGLLRSGDAAEVELAFLYRPEFLEKGQIFIFREGRTRGLGVVTDVG